LAAALRISSLSARQIEFRDGLFELPIFESLVRAEPPFAQLSKQLDAPLDLQGMLIGLLYGEV
jgi:hypothetical protein